MASIVIFGTKENSELADYYIESDTVNTVVAFCIDGAFIKENSFCGKPVVPFEEIEASFPPEDCKFIAPLAPSSMNKTREAVYNRIKNKNYEFTSYVSSKATVLTKAIGENCFILENNTIQPFVKIGNNALIWSGNHIGHHSVINDHVTITSQVVISGRCNIGSYSFFGVNSTVRDGVTIGEGTFVSLGSIITGDTPPWSVYKSASAELLKIPSTRVRF